MLLNFIAYLLFFEIVVIIALVTFLVLGSLYTSRKNKKRAERQKNMKALILKGLKGGQEINPDQLMRLGDEFDLLVCLNFFNDLFQTVEWSAIKEKLLTDRIMKKARKWVNASSYLVRQKAACFLKLKEDPQDEKKLIQLLNDPNSLVRIESALAITQMSSPSLIEALINRMKSESKLAIYPYRDALIHAHKKTFEVVQSLFEKSEDPEFRSCCLDILSWYPTKKLIDQLRLQVNTLSEKDLLAYVKALLNFPGEETMQSLLSLLKHPDWQVRAAAAHGLGVLELQEALFNLAELLEDSIWQVRMEAALSLKKMGEEGLSILHKQDPDISLRAYEAARYALASSTHRGL